MQMGGRKLISLVLCVFAVTVFSGCTNWKGEYDKLKNEHENLLGRYKRELGQKGALAEELSQKQQIIDELQSKIEQFKQSPGRATGFGEDYDVAFDASAGTITVTLQNRILFSPGQAKLKKATSRELDHIQSVLKSKYSGRQVDVVGHTDSDPIKLSGWADNWELSGERALSVLRYLVKRGLAEDEIRAVGCGAARPVDSNATPAGKAKNRRVEIVVHLK